MKLWRFRDFIGRCRRAWQYAKLSWPLCDGDWSSIATVLLYQIRRVRQQIDEHHIIADADRCVKQMRIAEHCLDRLLRDTGGYSDIAKKRYGYGSKRWADMISELERQDLEILTHELRRHLTNWWD